MSKKILFCTLFILIFLIPSKQDPNAKTWERRNTTVSADSILAAIDRGDEITIYYCRIIDSLIIEGQWGKPDTIKSHVGITQTIFSDRVSFSHCRFLEIVDFAFDSFCQNVNFEDATFGRDADFQATTFGGNANFSIAKFDSTAYFRHATFGGDAYFSDATFGGNANFSSVTFDTNVYIDFLRAKFDSTANFSDATFGGNADFSSATFDTNAYIDFLRAKFDSTANFSDATFGGNANFGHATFGGNANFSDATFDKDAYFHDAQFDKEVYLRLREFKNIDISWKQLKDHLICDPPVAYKLMKQFEEKRMVDDADGIYLFMKDQERMRKSSWVRYPEYWFIQLTCGYGTKPLNTFILSIILVILFAFFFTNSRAIKEIEKDFWSRRRPRMFREIPKSWRKRFYYALYFSLHTFIIGVVSDWHATDEFLINMRKRIKLFRFRNPFVWDSFSLDEFLIDIKRIRLFRFRTLSMIEGALGWILLTVWVVTLTRKFIR